MSSMHEPFLVNNQSKSESPLFQKGINPTTAILWMSDKDGKCTYLSKKWNEFTGNLHYQKAMEYRLADIHPEDRQEVSRVFFTAHDQQKAFILEYRLKSKRDRYRWVIDAGNPRYDKQNNFIGFAGTILDIQEQKVSAIDLNLKSQVIENSLNGFDIVDENGTFIYVNSAYVKMWGYDSADEIIGTSPASH